jgi:hypothetical protein
LDNLLAVHIETRSSNLATFGTGACHATAHTFYQKCSFHLAQHGYDAKERSSQCSRRVERLAQRHELDAARVEFVENLKEVLRGACKAVTRPNNQHIKVSPPGLSQHAVERRAACFRPAECQGR